MKTRTITLAIASLIGLSVVVWMGNRQVRLSREVKQLQGELVEARGEPADARPLPMPTARPGQNADLAGLDVAGQNAALRKKVSELRGEIATLKEQSEPIEERTLASPKPMRSWGHEQVLGEPNTPKHGDISSAWAPMAQNGGTEWLEVGFDNPVSLAEINVHETYNPGAISQIAVMMPDGSERVIWEGEFSSDDAVPGIVERAFQVDQEITADSVRIYMDTTRVSGWNEIDAVELVGTDDSRQWASSARASSTYARQ
jgi:hypothetical protein